MTRDDALREVAEEAVAGMAHDWYCPRDPNCQRVNCRWCVAEIVADALANELAALRAKAAAADRAREVVADLESYVAARGRPATGTYDDGLNRAQVSAAADLRRALDGADRTDRGRC